MKWVEEGLFKADPASPKPKYSIVIPPPNVTGSLHVGHALDNTLQDILCRSKRMQGFEVLWLPGTDHAGIATQNVVERPSPKRDITPRPGPRSSYPGCGSGKRVRSTIIRQLKNLGLHDWDRERFTMDEGLSVAVRKIFVDLYNKGSKLLSTGVRDATRPFRPQVEHQRRKANSMK